MKESGMVLAAILVAGITTEVASQSVPHWTNGCLDYWKQYRAKPSHKAFAIKRSVTADYFHCGYSWSAASVAQAKVGALNSCKHKACYVSMQNNAALLAIALTGAGCASSSTDIEAAYVSPI